MRVHVRKPSALAIVGRHTDDGFAVTGVLLGRGRGIPAAEVTLLAQAPGGTTWTVVDSKRTKRHGRVRFVQPPAPAPATSSRSRATGGSRRASVESWSTEVRPEDRKGSALDDTGNGETLDGPEPIRARVRQRAPRTRTRSATRSRRPAMETRMPSWCSGAPCTPPLLRYLRVRGEDAPEDLAAETWVHVVKGLASFEGGAAEFRAWLFTIARHRAIDQSRGRARRPAAVPVADPAQMAAHPTARSAEDDAVANDETARALALVATLPPDQAEAVMLRVVAGLEVADVARLLGKKPGTVRVMVHRALRTLAGDARPRFGTRGGVTWSTRTGTTTTRWCVPCAAPVRPTSSPTRSATARCSARPGATGSAEVATLRRRPGVGAARRLGSGTALTVALAVAGTGVAAAYTGNLPDPMQEFAHRALGPVGPPAPEKHHRRATDPVTTAPTTDVDAHSDPQRHARTVVQPVPVRIGHLHRRPSQSPEPTGSPSAGGSTAPAPPEPTTDTTPSTSPDALAHGAHRDDLAEPHGHTTSGAGRSRGVDHRRLTSGRRGPDGRLLRSR